MKNKYITATGLERKLPELKTFSQCWSWMKDKTGDATLEVTPIMVNGETTVMLVDEDGIAKRLELNPVASAYRENYIINKVMAHRGLVEIYGDVMIINPKINREDEEQTDGS